MKYAVHKFRSTIGKAHALKHNEHVLLAYSGGLSSGSMVKLIKEGLDLSESKKIKMVFKPTLVHIDEGLILNLSKHERKETTDFVLEQAKKNGFDVYICSLEYCLAPDLNDLKLEMNSYQIESSIYESQLETLFGSVKSLTAKEDLLIRLKQRLITLLATRLNHAKVFLGPNATRLAGQLLSAIGQGRGAQIAHEIGFTDSRTGTVFLRPMREFVDKEVAYLANFLGVDSVCLPTLSSKLGSTASIGRLTEDFVVTLQTNFPATISTLFRISDKLKSNIADPNPSDCERDSLCLLCLSAIEESSVCSASTARHISQTISRSGPNDDLRNHSSQSVGTGQHQDSTSCNSNCNSQGKPCCKTSNDQIQSDWSAVLCYGCRITMEDVKKPELMPINYLEELRLRSRRQVMRQSVEQFLL
ncbi:cytoplasmic tRNA 2-thiolation protein 2-B-like isoform X2 [Daphnia pulex]|nr:cytoplasmic tRNA 2-thiolation protein 2-B-like isoform X2 [Daphnia pulex]